MNRQIQNIKTEAKRGRCGEFQRIAVKAEKSCFTLNRVTTLRHKEDLIEEILSRENMFLALQQVERNKGCSGIDGMNISELRPYLKENWLRIKAEVLEGKYQPQPIKRVDIPKNHGGKRRLGIPTLMDRVLQQAIMQTLQSYVDQSFSNQSYGFRPRKSAHQALKESHSIIRSGYEYMIDIDIEQCFDRINHDKLMSILHGMIKDQRVLDLIRKYLNTGMNRESGEGILQGSPLSPLLANVYLDLLDKELERRDHKFVRYADDIKIMVKSEKASRRVMESVSRYLEKKLKLRTNQGKSSIGKKCKFLGYIVRKGKLGIAVESIKAFKEKIREKTRICGGRSMRQILDDLNPIILGWYEYFKLKDTKSPFKELDGWIRRRVRACYYAQLKNGNTRFREFLKQRIEHERAYKCAYSSRGVWFASKGDVMQEVLSTNKLKNIGLASLLR